MEFRASDWTRSAALYDIVLRDHLSRFESVENKIRGTLIGLSKRRFERAAFAFAMIDEVEKALAVTELGRARSMKSRLGMSSEAHDFADALSWKPSPPPENILIIAPVITPQGTVVFGIGRREGAARVEVLFLPEFDGELATNHIGDEGGWLSKYAKAVNFDPDMPISGIRIAEDISDAIKEMHGWLGPQFAEPIVEWAENTFEQGFTSIVFAVQGELAILPIHLAIVDDAPLLARYGVSYTPSVALFGGKQPSPKGIVGKLAVISNPSLDARLPVSHLEARVIAQAWPGSDAAARPAVGGSVAVLEAMGASDIFHFVGHGSYDASDPLNSYLLVGSRQRLTVREIAQAPASQIPSLVVLSACETGIVGLQSASNEYEGLTGAFLGAGTQGVVASLWPVNEFPTMLIMHRFYEQLADGYDPAEALRSAQLWLSRALGSELLSVVDREFMPQANADPIARPAMASFRKYLDMNENRLVYGDPYYWAGFIYTGI